MTPLCLPDEGTCEPCVDPDGDGYGNEGDCLGVDCDEEDPLSYEGAAEICDGRDNDSDTLPDNNVPRTSAPLDLACAQMGVCEGSQPACENAEWTCQYPDTFQDGGELTCDGLDNDCDGTVDEALAPPPANLVVGVCLGSTQVCGGEAGFGEPDYAQIEGFEPIETICDGLDNDCDNTTDENIELDLADLQSGVCEGAQKACAGERGIVEPDYAQFAGYENIEATCDGLDNDCDGQTDEALQPPLADNQAGVCGGSQKVCSGGDGFVEPVYAEIARFEAVEVTCDGLDNDCDGATDNGLQQPVALRQQGVCAGSLQVCNGQAGFQEPDYTEIMAYELAEATCDGLDNDCDGNLDESIQPPLADIQNGVCSGAVRVCAGVDGFVEPDYAEINDYQENENTCDGLDNDCDGAADEGVVLPPADRTDGVCAGAVKVCAGQAGFNEPDYTAIAAYEVVETTCDGLDNDCDGNVDEGVVPPLADNQNGVCAGTNKACGGAQGFIEPEYTALAQYNALDVPDDLLDTNCDGVVGVRDELIYLTPWGMTLTMGSLLKRLFVHARALAVAGNFRARDIALATGQWRHGPSCRSMA